jgi:hypothetical protein
MLAFLVVIFWTLASVRAGMSFTPLQAPLNADTRAAFEDDFEIVSPTPGQNFSAGDPITVAWNYGNVYDCPVTIQVEVQLPGSLLSPGPMVVGAKAQGLVVDSGAMPLVSANATATMNIQVYTTHVVTGDVYSDGTGVYSILVTEATSTTSTPATVDHTVTETPTPNPTSISSSDSEPTETPVYYPPMIGEGKGGDDEDYMQDDGGLSSGAKAGIGAGVAVGTVLLVVGAILLHRRHKMRNSPKTIREITSGPSQAEL